MREQANLSSTRIVRAELWTAQLLEHGFEHFIFKIPKRVVHKVFVGLAISWHSMDKSGKNKIPYIYIKKKKVCENITQEQGLFVDNSQLHSLYSHLSLKTRSYQWEQKETWKCSGSHWEVVVSIWCISPNIILTAWQSLAGEDHIRARSDPRKPSLICKTSCYQGTRFSEMAQTSALYVFCSWGF